MVNTIWSNLLNSFHLGRIDNFLTIIMGIITIITALFDKDRRMFYLFNIISLLFSLMTGTLAIQIVRNPSTDEKERAAQLSIVFLMTGIYIASIIAIAKDVIQNDLTSDSKKEDLNKDKNKIILFSILASLLGLSLPFFIENYNIFLLPYLIIFISVSFAIILFLTALKVI